MEFPRKKRRWLIAGLSLLGFALLLWPLLRVQRPYQWSVALDSADAGFYQLTWEEPATNLLEPKYICRARVYYVVKVFTRTPAPNLGVIGTNTSQAVRSPL